MLADFLLRLLGRNPIAYPDPIDKWSVIAAGFAFYGAPIVLILLFLTPFLFLLIRRRTFNLKNIVIAGLIGVGLVGLGIYAMYQGLIYLQGEAFKDFYGID